MKSNFKFIEEKEVLDDEDKIILNGDVAIYIFKDIDRILNKCLNDKSLMINGKQLKKEYEILKDKWL